MRTPAWQVLSAMNRTASYFGDPCLTVRVVHEFQALRGT